MIILNMTQTKIHTYNTCEKPDLFSINEYNLSWHEILKFEIGEEPANLAADTNRSLEAFQLVNMWPGKRLICMLD